MTKNEIETLIKESEEFIDSVIQKKYCYPGESSWEDVCKRFKDTLEKDKDSFIKEDFAERIYNRMLQKMFIPAGSVLFGFGKQDKNVSLSNCYFIPIEHDSIEGIYEFLKKQARTYSWRGGVGTDISILRPKGTKVNNSAVTSSGAVSFMPLLSESTNTIGQNGRRGAHLISISDWHPDVLDFIKCKTKPEEVFDYDYINGYLPNVYYANISVKLSDKFLEAYEKDEDWMLMFPDIEKDKEAYEEKWNGDIEEWKQNGGSIKEHKKIKAKDMLKQIAQSAWQGAEPGVLYWDNSLEFTPWAKIDGFKARGVNPCGEQILASWSNCNLHAIVLYKYVRKPYTKEASFDFESLKEDIPYFLEFGDYIVDINKHPLDEQNKMDKLMRKVGIEFTGLGDMLAMLGLKYGSKKANQFLDNLFRFINQQLFLASIELSKEKGSAPMFEDDSVFEQYMNSTFIQRTLESFENKEDIEQDLKQFKIRNASWSNNGPTGSISIVADNCTSGIEPLFQLVYKRNSRLLGKETTVVHLPLLKWLKENAPEDLELSAEELKKKYNYVEAHELDWKQRLETQATIQKWITDSISSTVNLPKDITPDEIMQIYYEGWKLGLKGVTIYRDGSLTGILNKVDDKKDDDKEDKTEPNKQKIEIPQERNSFTYTLLWKRNKVYITVAYVDKKPVEVFAKLPPEAYYDDKGRKSLALKEEREANWSALCRLISRGLRWNIPVEEIIKDLNKSSSVIGDLPNVISRALSKTMTKLSNNSKTLTCPVCKQNTLVKTGGCEVCSNCGYSKCE